MARADQERERPEVHSVGVVRSLGEAGASHHQDWVRCERRGGSIPVSECRDCPHCAAIAVDQTGSVHSVTCFSGALLDAERRAGQTPLSMPRVTVGDVMTRNVLCVRPDLSLDAATELFVESGLKAAPVVDEHGALLGIVSESDVLVDVYARSGQPPPEPRHGPPDDEELLAVARARTVSDVMIPFAFTLPENASVTRAAAVMAFEGAYRVTVVAPDGRVVGVLSAGDVLYWLAKADGYALPPPRRSMR